jgi:DNA-binding CsgD family transcriptional regulator
VTAEAVRAPGLTPESARLAGMSSAGETLALAMSGRSTSPVLVGRAEQMTALEGAFESVRQGGPAAVLLGGEAGVGKSRLVSEFSVTARRAGARVLTGGCMMLGIDGLPFAPFTAILRGLVHEMGADAFAAMLPGRTTRELARLLPELSTTEADSDDGGAARARLFEEMLSALEQLAARSPVVLVIEDAHWADRSSRDLLTFLIGNQRAIEGLLVLITFRSDELHRTHPLRPLLATLDRIDWVQRIDLPRLSRPSTSELAVRIIGRDLAEDVSSALYRRTEGNPLFIETLLCCDGDLSRELPDSLRDLLLDSVRRLPEETQDVLRAASTGGGVTGHALLVAVTGLDDAVLTRALRAAVTANVLRAEADGYVFRHELIREAVHDDLLPGEHGRLHNKFAEAIDADPALVPPGRAAIEKAHHWNSGHDTTWALIASWQAAAQAGRAVAPAERLELIARVLELWDQVPDAPSRIGATHLEVLAEATAAAQDADDYERGIALATSALKETDPASDPVRAGLLLEARARFKMHSSRQGYPADFEEALRLVPPGLAPAARVKILLSVARCVTLGPGERRYAQEALELARQAGNVAAEANALLALAMFDADDGQQAAPGSSAIELIAQARALASQAGDQGVLLNAAINESHLLEGAGEHELAFAAARDGIAGADEQRLPRISGSLLSLNQVEPLFALGRWDEALQVADSALAVYLVPVPGHRAALRVMRGAIALARGDVDDAAQFVSGAGESLRCAMYKLSSQLPFCCLQSQLALARDPAAAVATVAETLDTHELSSANPRYAWPVLTAAADACLGAARQAGPLAAGTADGGTADGGTAPRGGVAAIMDQLRTVALKTDAFGRLQEAHRLTFSAADADITRLLGSTAADFPELLAGWDAAAAAWEAIGEPYPLAQVLLHAAEAALEGGDRDAATERLHRAVPLAAGLGAEPLAGQIAALARRARIWLGDGPAAPGTAAGQTGATLTVRELEVLRLVAAGRSNREIAAELFISPKTASVHVSNILGKLGAGSRTEAAARAHALRLLA